MKILFTLIAFFILTACISSLGIQEINGNDLHYQALITQSQNNPTISTVMELREVYPQTGQYRQSLIIEKQLHQPILSTITDNAWQDCLTYSQQLLAVNYTSLSGHYGAMVCQLELGQKQHSLHHQNMLNMLLEAIWTGANGESIESAFVAISEQEISQFIEFHALDIIKQHTIVIEEKTYKQVSLHDSRNEDLFDWYFDITAFAEMN